MVANESQLGDTQNRLYVNDGFGVFRDETSRMPVDTYRSFDVAAGDVNGDGDPDLVFANAAPNGARNTIYINQGDGSFKDQTIERMPPLVFHSFAVALGDVDGDEDLDIVFGNAWDAPFYSFDGRNRLYLNNGAGGFTDGTAGRLPNDGTSTDAVTLSTWTETSTSTSSSGTGRTTPSCTRLATSCT